MYIQKPDVYQGSKEVKFILTLMDGSQDVNASLFTSMSIVGNGPRAHQFTGNVTLTSVQDGGSGDGQDGKVTFVSSSSGEGDFPYSGDYHMQVVCQTATGEWPSEIYSIKVGRKLKSN